MDYPSGPWTGFYNYGSSSQKHRMDLVPIFGNRTVSGDGSDDIGRFLVSGRFDETKAECFWTKTYIGRHDVYYRGFREGKGIWGLWELPNESGGFHIWPVGEEEGEQDHESTEEPAPVEAVATETSLSIAAGNLALMVRRPVIAAKQGQSQCRQDCLHHT